MTESEKNELTDIVKNENSSGAEEITPTPCEALSECTEVKDEEYKPSGGLERAAYYVYKNETLTEILKILSHISVLLTAYAFIYHLVLIAGREDFIRLAVMLLSTGIPFVIVTVVRKVFNSPRPYELYPFYKKPPKSKVGQSFPSRHVFSIFVIATVLLSESLPLGVGLMLLGVLLGVCRVLLGYHFIRDTVAGAVIGALSGTIGHLVFGLL